MRRTAFVSALLFGAALWGFSACAADDGGGINGDSYGAPDGSTRKDGGDPGGDGGLPPKEESDLSFPEGTVFTRRDCTLTLTFTGAASDVKLAGEFTNWETGALPLTKVSSGYAVTLSPSAELPGGQLLGYKLIVDGQWRLDPAGKYRKLIGGQMNSALQLPACEEGPELLPRALTVGNSTAQKDTAAAKVHIDVRAANDGDAPLRILASLDRAKIPDGTWTFDGTGGVDFDFPSLPRGKHTLSLRTVDGKDREAEPVDLPFWVEDETFDYRDGVLYMFMIDRFANGDKANDRPIGNPVHYDADWHGGDLQGARKVLESGYFEKIGARTIWLSPTNQQTDKSQSGDGNQIFSAYHGYWPTKARDVEPRFGGVGELHAFVKEAHKRGIRVLLDLINNQVHEDHEYIAQHSDWFRTACQCGDDARGCGWSQRPFDCLFQPYLPDIDWTQSGAEKQFIADAVNWIAEYDLDGFRVDAVKHVEANSVYNMRAELTRRFEQAGARIFMVGETAVGENDSGTFFGETFSDGFAWIDAYTGPTALDGQFDFPTRHNMADGLVSGLKPLNEVEDQLRKSESRYKTGNRHVRFLNGHDNPRIASIAAQDPKLGCTWASGCRGADLPPAVYTDPQVYVKLKRALTVLYTLPGVPYIYAGDEVAFPGGADPDMRRDMRFAEPELADSQMVAPGGQVAALTPAQIDLRDWVRKLGATRLASKALRRGNRVTLLGSDADFWVYAWQAGNKEIAVVAINRGGDVTRSVSGGLLRLTGVTGFTSAMGNGSAALTAQGDVSITLGAGQAGIFLAK